MKKSIIAILTAAVITLSFLGPLLYTAEAADPTEWYKTVTGVLDTDTYELYPFSTSESLTIGFSQFGEMINSIANVGLEYGAVDAFAPPAGSAIGSIVKSAWLNGWLCNITYYHTIRSELRTIWTSAQHGDPIGVTYGNNWIRVDFLNDYNTTYGYEDPRDPGFTIGNYAAGSGNYGGRKTNGTVVTQPIKVLYDGPRSYVALLRTTIYDHFVYLSDSTSEDIPLLEVRFMILFNKVKKEVVVFKELKTLISDKYTDQLKVQFSNRGEVDLGTEDTGYASYFHFYTQGTSRGPNWQGTGKNYENNDTLPEGLSTVYNSNWVLNKTEDPITSTYYNYSAAGPYPQDTSATYDLAVAINPTEEYTWWAAFWPSLSDWNIDGWPMWWRSMSATDPHDIDSRNWETIPRTEPTIPYYIGEWDVVLRPVGKPTHQQFRFVTIYGVTDQHNADDANMGEGHSNVIDRETMYQLDEYFNPWDLQQAVHKKNTRWVEFTFGPSWTSDYAPVIDVDDADWDQYCTFSERVIDLNKSVLLHRVDDDPLVGSTHDYHFSVDPVTGHATITGLNSSRYYKILYSTDTEYADWGPFTLSEEWIGTTELGTFEAYDYDDYEDLLGAHHYWDLWADFDIQALTELAIGNNFTLTGALEYEAWDFKVFKEGYFETDLNPEADDDFSNWHHFDENNYFSINFTQFDLDWGIAPPWPFDLHMDFLVFDVEYSIFVVYNGTSGQYPTWNVTATFNVVPDDDYEGMPIYAEHIPGRYEWVVVGRDAQSVDSAGAALVTAAFKNKQIEIGLAGADMYNSVPTLQMPWVMAKIGAGYTRDNYYYTGTDYRTALKDDWCHTWPIASSNIISVAGPRANALTWYGNDFAEAFFGLTEFTDEAAWDTKIVPKTCWNHTKAYASTTTTGYAVVSTYKDINGTVLFMIWGYDGRDTFYVTKWFHEEGIYQLQEAPDGLTSIIVKITYSSTGEGYKPSAYSIVECLGTISERQWIHDSTIKGGIHDP